MPWRAFSVFGRTQSWITPDLTVYVLMPWRAFSVFGPTGVEAVDDTTASVLMPWRAFSVFGLMRTRYRSLRTMRLNALAGIQCFRTLYCSYSGLLVGLVSLNALAGIQCFRTRNILVR